MFDNANLVTSSLTGGILSRGPAKIRGHETDDGRHPWKGLYELSLHFEHLYVDKV